MSPVEKEHLIRAHTFELGQCHEQAIKERQPQALANIDPVLCSEVATGLGLPAPEPTETLGESGADGSAGVVTGESAAAVLEEVQQLMASHRVWERFPSSVA